MGTGKNFKVCGYPFLYIEKLQVSKLSHKYLLYTSMKIPNKRELQQIDILTLKNLYKKSTAESYSFLVIDTILLSDDSLCFRKNLLETI